jgi:conjugal transfer pilus assembly protein TrbC
MGRVKTNIVLNSVRKTSQHSFAAILVLVLFLFLVFLVFCDSSIASMQNNHEDYEAYAKEQAQRKEKIIAPYQAEINELVKNALSRQTHQDIQTFKKEIADIAKTQCSLQNQDVGSVQLPIIIFVSFSMPKESIKGWITQAKKVGAAVYIRGLVNNSFKDTAKIISGLVQDQSGGLLIDPTLFKKHSITQVPAVVVVNRESFDVIYGDVTLDYALEKINKPVSGNEQKYLLVRKLRNSKTKLKQ